MTCKPSFRARLTALSVSALLRSDQTVTAAGAFRWRGRLPNAATVQSMANCANASEGSSADHLMHLNIEPGSLIKP